VSQILWKISVAKAFISEHEREELANVKYWLCVARKAVFPLGDDGDDLYEKAQQAMSALQILCPSGAKNVFLKFAHTEQGYDNTGILAPKGAVQDISWPYCSGSWHILMVESSSGKRCYLVDFKDGRNLAGTGNP
jgi:hypothetical protein